MAFERGLLLRAVLLLATLALLLLAFKTPGLVAARIVAVAMAATAGWLLWRHVTRTNREIARFVEALRLGDTQVHFDRLSGTGFGRMGAAFETALARLRAERATGADELKHCQALLDDMPVALLVAEGNGRVTLSNKAARRMFAQHRSTRAENFAGCSAGLAARLRCDGPDGSAMLVLNLGRAQRAMVRAVALQRLGRPCRAVTVEPVQEAMNAVEMAAQADIVRVLTHEILNSLTPVRSLATTAAALLAEDDPARRDDARTAVATLARRAEGLGRFVESYRAVTRELVPQRRRFLAAPFARELALLFAVEWPDVALAVTVEPEALTLNADPDLLAQAAINLLRNAAEATATTPHPAITLAVSSAPSRETLVEVTDNGPGVPEVLRHDVFLPFFTTRATGTGVGLNLVRQIAVAHGGSVEVDDAAGGGARFRLRV